uniref:Uncharacterized protein n=1 Tax=Cacopsylla melanoneura TaxID=428564 RepID=A0A8D8QE20_9HEMI
MDLLEKAEKKTGIIGGVTIVETLQRLAKIQKRVEGHSPHHIAAIVGNRRREMVAKTQKHAEDHILVCTAATVDTHPRKMVAKTQKRAEDHILMCTVATVVDNHHRRLVTKEISMATSSCLVEEVLLEDEIMSWKGIKWNML